MGAEKINLPEEAISSISNHDFMEAVFLNLTGDARPFTISKKANSGKRAWAGKHWNPQHPELLSSNDNYLSLAAYKPDEENMYRRKKEHFHSLHALLLDDIGTKVPMEALRLRPSALIETSPGNFHAIYFLKDAITDPEVATQLMNAVIEKKLTDKGSNEPCTRLARLPNGRNSKPEHNPGFVCKLREFDKNLRYSVQELVDAFGLELKPITKAAKPRVLKANSIKSASSEAVNTANRNQEINALENLLEPLRGKGLYKHELGSGKHEISCPWLDEHTGKIDSGTVYYEPSDEYPSGGFKCQHDHCANRHIKNLQIELGSRIPVLVENGEMLRLVEETEEILASNANLYQMEQNIVRLSMDSSNGRVSILPVSLAALTLECSKLITYYEQRENGVRVVNPPSREIALLSNRQEYRYLRVLRSLTHQPFFDEDRLISTPGYDSKTKTVGVFDQKDFNIQENPTREDAIKALEIIKELIQEFIFSSLVDEAGALLAILTATVRPSLATAPMFGVFAHSPGSGKSYLCNLIAIFATSQTSNSSIFPTGDDECRKVLVSAFREAGAVITFDNLNWDILPHQSLCAALTSETLSDRLLGQSQMVTVSTRQLVLANGNNVRPEGDMVRRCIPIHLNPKDEDLIKRQYSNPNLLETARAQRGKYVSAALTIIQAWICAGKPKNEHVQLSGYTKFLDICLQPLLWLGCPDPMQLVQKSLETDPVRGLLGRVLEVWYRNFGEKQKMLKDALLITELEEFFVDIAPGERGSVNRRKAGKWIKRCKGRRVNGLYFEESDLKGASVHWKVKKI